MGADSLMAQLIVELRHGLYPTTTNGSDVVHPVCVSMLTCENPWRTQSVLDVRCSKGLRARATACASHQVVMTTIILGQTSLILPLLALLFFLQVEAYFFDIRKQLNDYDEVWLASPVALIMIILVGIIVCVQARASGCRLLEVLNTQRNKVYANRRRALISESLESVMIEYAEKTVDDILEVYCDVDFAAQPPLPFSRN
eukprot:scaffold147891_cov35-Prasinocladus_malaysianus.AAC.1